MRETKRKKKKFQSFCYLGSKNGDNKNFLSIFFTPVNLDVAVVVAAVVTEKKRKMLMTHV